MAILNAGTYFTILDRHEQLVRRILNPVAKRFGLSNTGLDIVCFLAANPALNTARDICNLQGMKSGIVSVTVEQLIGRKLLERRPDPEDRRVQRLFVTEEAMPIVEAGQAARQTYEEMLASGLTPEEQEELIRLCRKLWAHMGTMLGKTK